MRPLIGMNPYDVSNRVQYDNESIESYIDRVFGREINDLLIEGLARTMTTSSRDRTSVIEFFAGAVLASGKMQTIKGGLQLLPTRLAAQLDVRLNSPVTAVRRTEDGVEVEYQNLSRATAVAHADACVIATPFREAAEIYPPLKGLGAELLKATKDSGCVSVQLTYGRCTDTQPFLIMVPAASSPKVGTLFVKHVKASEHASAGASLITAFIPLHSDDESAGGSDECLIGVVRDLVERVFPELRGHRRAARLKRWAYASHQGRSRVLHRPPAIPRPLSSPRIRPSRRRLSGDVWSGNSRSHRYERCHAHTRAITLSRCLRAARGRCHRGRM